MVLSTLSQQTRNDPLALRIPLWMAVKWRRHVRCIGLFPPHLPPCLYFWWFCPVLSTSFLTAPFNQTIFNLRHLVRSGYFYKGRVLWPTAAYYSCSLDPYFHFHVAAHTSVTQVKLMINALIIALWILVPILFWELLCIHPFSAMIVEDWGGGGVNLQRTILHHRSPKIWPVHVLSKALQLKKTRKAQVHSRVKSW